jgi:hypothetical protein
VTAETEDGFAVSPARDASGTPAWRLVPPDHVRPDGLPAVVTDPSALETPLLQRILKTLREEYDPDFAVRWLGPVPHTPLASLAEARVALVTTAGLHVTGDAPFDPYTVRWGDTGFRFIPHLTPPRGLDLAAEYVDPKYIRKDPEVALPMAALQHWVDEGVVGSAAPRHVGFCEGVVRPFPGLAESARAAAATLREDGVNAALVLPSCSLCVLNVCVIARELEAGAVSTVVLTPLPELTAIAGAPRVVRTSFPLGAPAGNPGNPQLHRRVIRALLTRLDGTPVPEASEDSLAWRS